MKKTAQKRRELSPSQRDELIEQLKDRFATHMSRHRRVEWAEVESALRARPDKLWSLSRMEATGGEPDVVQIADGANEYIFVDCSAQSPSGRRSLCYDREALNSRKAHKPKNTAMDLAVEMGVELVTEEQYHALQKLGEFDTTTSSWLLTPADVRQLGGAIFGDRRFGRVFLYHNGAESYYAGRGFRGLVRISRAT